jgi:hypothetical protein
MTLQSLGKVCRPDRRWTANLGDRGRNAVAIFLCRQLAPLDLTSYSLRRNLRNSMNQSASGPQNRACDITRSSRAQLAGFYS